MGRGKPFTQSVNRLINAGVVPRPIWLTTVENTRPVFEPIRETKSRKIEYPEDRLRQIFMDRNPDARRRPIDLKARSIPERHLADKFVAIQRRFMEENDMAEEEAYNSAYRVINVDAIQDGEKEEVYGPLVNQAVQDEAARLYVASVRDSMRDQKHFRALLKQTKQET